MADGEHGGWERPLADGNDHWQSAPVTGDVQWPKVRARKDAMGNMERAMGNAAGVWNLAPRAGAHTEPPGPRGSDSKGRDSMGALTNQC